MLSQVSRVPLLFRSFPLAQSSLSLCTLGFGARSAMQKEKKTEVDLDVVNLLCELYAHCYA